MQKVIPYLGVFAVASYTTLLWLPLSFDLALYVLILVAGCAIWLAEPASLPTWPWPDGLVTLILLVSMVSIAVSADLYRSLTLSSAFAPAGLIYLMMTRYIRAPAQLSIVMLGLVLSVLGISFTVLIQLFSSADPVARIQEAAIPILVVPNDILFLSLISPLSLSLLVVTKSRLVRAVIMIGVGATIASVVALESRSGLIVMGFSAVIASSGPGRPASVLKVVILGLLSAFVFDALSGFPLLTKFASLCENRVLLWAAAWELFLERPFFGHGMHTFRDLYQSRIPAAVLLLCEPLHQQRIAPWPHNLFLELLSSQGLLGTTVFCATLAWAFTVAWSTTASGQRFCRVLAWGLLGALGGFVLAGLIELSLLRLWVVILFAVLIGTAAQLKNCANNPRYKENNADT